MRENEPIVIWHKKQDFDVTSSFGINTLSDSRFHVIKFKYGGIRDFVFSYKYAQKELKNEEEIGDIFYCDERYTRCITEWSGWIEITTDNYYLMTDEYIYDFYDEFRQLLRNALDFTQVDYDVNKIIGGEKHNALWEFLMENPQTNYVLK